MPIPITGLFVPSGGVDAFNLVSWHDVANHNFVATDPPGVDNDLNDASEPTNPEGYRVGSFWCDIVHGKVYVCLDPADGAAVWIEITAVGGSGGGGLSGIDFAANGDPLCFAAALGLQEGTGVWISGTCVGGEAAYTVGAYPSAAAPTSISGVDALLDSGPVCFARAFDFHQTSTVWISGSCSGQEADFTFGAYPSAAGGTSISGVDAKVENAAVCFARAFDFHAGTGLWVSGTCANQEAEITFGASVDAANVTYAPVASGTDWDGGIDPGNLGPAVDQLAERIRNGTLVFDAYNMWPSTGTGALTDGCAWPARRELITNGKNIYFMAFDSATDEAGEGSGELEVWDGGTVTVTIHWTTVAAAGTTVCWSVSLGATADDGALDAAFGTPVAVTDTVLAAGDLHICTTAAITVAGAGAGKHLQIRIMRDVSEDTCASDADLIRAIVHYNRRDA